MFGFLSQAVEAGAGEVLINSVDRDGMMQGMDLGMVRKVSHSLDMPLIAIGGVGCLNEIKQAVEAGGSAVAVGSFFVFYGPHRAVLITYPEYPRTRSVIGIKMSEQICMRCVMDTSAKDIFFDKGGVCNFCSEFLLRSGHILNKDSMQRSKELDALIAKIKKDGKGKKYDCIVGVSGGVDSSWVLVNTVKLGLRPLADHMDNGWNSELAQHNIANLVHGLDVDLYTHVIDWDEYKRLMQAFFDADVIDIELLYDNAMLGVNYNLATKHGVKYIFSGCNQATEGMKMPEGWNWLKFDKLNIKAIGKKHGNIRLSTFPAIGTLGLIWNEFVRKRQWYPFLDYLEFNKFQALEILQRDFAYKPYESVFTRFYQGYILPEKFGVEKKTPFF